ncbi:uncharacterized protein LOC141850253 [Brevipalpus obovatus]|uniref:uncharacterized protein LOC141850253 n=1 Tax=Brevipalpus obovatus TaxID=246614 RepID=UPI003D9DE383
MSVLNSGCPQISQIKVKSEPVDDFCQVLMVKKPMNNISSQVCTGKVKSESNDNFCGIVSTKDENSQPYEVPMAQRLATALRAPSIPISQLAYGNSLNPSSTLNNLSRSNQLNSRGPSNRRYHNHGHGNRGTMLEQTFFNSLQSISITGLRSSRHLPTNLRSIGLITSKFHSQLANHLKRQDINQICPENVLYRVMLAQASVQIFLSRANANSPISPNSAQKIYSPTVGLIEAVKAFGKCFTPIAHLIRNLGNFEYGGNSYYPIFVETYSITFNLPPVTRSNRRQREETVTGPRPAEINLFNLRRLVELLSDRSTDENFRKLHQRQNSIPGANFVGNLLTNAYDIIPPDYGPEDFLRDSGLVEALIKEVESKVPRLVTSIPLNGLGTYAQLCYRVMHDTDETLRCGNRGIEGPSVWTVLCNLDVPPWMFKAGCYILSGEFDSKITAYSDRTPNGALMYREINWCSLLSNFTN